MPGGGKTVRPTGGLFYWKPDSLSYHLESESIYEIDPFCREKWVVSLKEMGFEAARTAVNQQE